MFDSLSERLQGVFGELRGHGKLSEADVDKAMREIRLALLEADVNFKVVREFVNHVKERALGAEVMESLTPAQQVVKIVDEELVTLMGSGDSRLAFSGRPPTVILLAGLQGSGKTTTCAKLAQLLVKDGKRPVLIAADVYRPAAIEQLVTLAERVGVPVFAPGAHLDPVDIARDGVAFARDKGDVAIIDTAAPPRASPSSLVSTTPVISSLSWKAFAVRTASWPIIASTTSRMLPGCTLDLIVPSSSMSTSSIARRPAVS